MSVWERKNVISQNLHFLWINFDKSCGWINNLVNLCSFPSWCPNMFKPTHPPPLGPRPQSRSLWRICQLNRFISSPHQNSESIPLKAGFLRRGDLFKWVNSFWPAAPSHRRQWAPIWSWSMHTETSRNVKGRRGGLLVSTPLTSFPKLVWLCLGFSFLAGPDRLAWALHQYQYQYHNSVGIS